MATRSRQWLKRAIPSEMRSLIREAIYGPVVDELELVHRFLGSATHGRVVLRVGSPSPLASNRFERDGWSVLTFECGGDRHRAIGDFCRTREPIERIDLLEIDVEGSQLSVLRDFPWDWKKPDVVVCRFADEKAELPCHYFHALADLLVAEGYQILVSEWYPTNSYDATLRWRRFVPYPCQLVSTYAWGNLIAVRGADELARLRGIAQS